MIYVPASSATIRLIASANAAARALRHEHSVVFYKRQTVFALQIGSVLNEAVLFVSITNTTATLLRAPSFLHTVYIFCAPNRRVPCLRLGLAFVERFLLRHDERAVSFTPFSLIGAPRLWIFVRHQLFP